MRSTLSSVLWCALAAGLMDWVAKPAAAEGVGAERAPLDPAAAVGELRRAYHKRAFVEALEITVESPGERRRESVTVRGNVMGELRLDLGDVQVWTEGPVLRAVHRLNAGVYFEKELAGSDRASAFLAALPPLPVPQVGLVLQPREASAGAWAPSPTCVGLTWDSAVAASHGRKPAVVLSGSSGAGAVRCWARVAAVGSPPALTFAETKSERDGVTTTVAARITRLEEPAGRLEADLRGRERVGSLGDLRAATPDVRAGLAMPELIAEPAERGGERAGALVPAGKTCVLVIFDAAPDAGGQDGGPVPFVHAALNAAGARGVGFRMLAAARLTDGKARARAVEMMQSIQRGAGFVSYSAATTLGRFVAIDGPEAVRAVAVVVDHTGLVRSVVPARGEGFLEDLRAALEGVK